MGRYEIDDNSIEHGLGVGGGRGRPKGSRNGYINPNAAYMKGYEVKGEVADYSDPLYTGKRPANPPRERTWAPSPQSPGPTRRITNKEAQGRLIDSFRKQGEYRASQRPAASVQSGKALMEKVLKEQIIPEETIEEQYLQETKPIETDKNQSEAPEAAKPDILADAWNGLLDWGRGAWKDISGTATSAINTSKGWAKSGLEWLNNNVLNPASEWGSRAVSDVSSWIGDRGRDLDRWWNGTDVRDNTIANEVTHNPGFRENAGNWLNQAGRDISDFASQAANNFWNGRLSGNDGDLIRRYTPGMRDYLLGNDERNVSGMLTNPLGFANQQLVEPIFGENGVDEWARDVNRNIGQSAQNAVNAAGQWIGDRGRDVDRWWNGTDVRDNTIANEVTHNPGFRENAGNAINSAARSAGEFATRAANDVGQFVSDRAQDALDLAGTTIQKVVDAAGDVRDAIVDGSGRVIGFFDTNVGQPVDRFLNGTTTYSGEYNPETGESVTTETHTPGFLENAGSFISSLPGQAQVAAGETIKTITDAYGRTREGVFDAAGNFVRWADNAIQDARIGASGVVNQESNTFGGMTNSILAQNARAAGLSPARLARLADVYGPNNVANFESVLFDYANGRISDEQIDEIIRNR